MKLYPKKINSIEELKREQLRLKYELKNTSSSDLIPNISIPGFGKKTKNESKSGLIGIATGLLTSKSWVQVALTLARPAFRLITKKKAVKNDQVLEADRKPFHKTLVRRIAVEFLGNYAKGKALQLGWKGIKLFIKSRKQ